MVSIQGKGRLAKPKIRMKIIIEKSDDPVDRVTWESPSDCHSLDELAESIKGMLVAFGYHPTSVNDLFGESAHDWFPEEILSKNSETEISDIRSQQGSK